MRWKTIRLELAATADFPNGSVGRGFLIRAPVADDGHIDERLVAQSPNRAKVRRVWPNEPDQRGRLVRVDGHWVMRFPGSADRIIHARAAFKAGSEVLVSVEDEQASFTVRLFG
ncbi:MAG TPA: hypothetical protein VM308_02155 [Sphingomicrobium sp.]|nr:hypothetical protein [Sphingomicrobium sp.]